MQRDVVPLNDHVHDNVDWYKKADILNFHDDDDVDDAQVNDDLDDDDDEAEVYDDVDDPEGDDDDVDDAQVDDDVEETDTIALPLKDHVVASIHEEAPADAVASENECINNIDEDVDEEVSGEMPLPLKIKLGDDIHVLVTVRLSIKL